MPVRGRIRLPKLRSSVANLALVAATCAVIAVLFELGVRVFEPQPANRYRFSPVSFYEPMPGARFVYRRQEFSVAIEYNALGMRDRERRIERSSPDVWRIALIGDSQVEAKEVPFDSTFGQRLERAMQQALPSRPVEVLNFGVSGYGTVATRARYEHLGLRFRPDVVVYLFMENDPDDNLGRDALLYEDRGDSLIYRQIHGGRIPLSRRLLDHVKHHSQGYAFLKFRLQEIRSRTKSEGAPQEIESGNTGWRVTALALRDLRDRVLGHGGQLAVVQAGTRGPDMSARLRALCSDLGIRYLDLAPALQACPERVHFQYDGHWRSAGHRAAAGAILPFLQASMRERE